MDIRGERTISMEGAGYGPALEELREFVSAAVDFPSESSVKIMYSSGGQRETPMWSLTISGPL